jgi:hypothetical protein
VHVHSDCARPRLAAAFGIEVTARDGARFDKSLQLAVAAIEPTSRRSAQPLRAGGDQVLVAELAPQPLDAGLQQAGHVHL